MGSIFKNKKKDAKSYSIEKMSIRDNIIFFIISFFTGFAVFYSMYFYEYLNIEMDILDQIVNIFFYMILSSMFGLFLAYLVLSAEKSYGAGKYNLKYLFSKFDFESILRIILESMFSMIIFVWIKNFFDKELSWFILEYLITKIVITIMSKWIARMARKKNGGLIAIMLLLIILVLKVAITFNIPYI